MELFMRWPRLLPSSARRLAPSLATLPACLPACLPAWLVGLVVVPLPLLLAASAARGADAAADFSPSQNPNGPWRYGQFAPVVPPAPITGPLILFPNASTLFFGVDTWNRGIDLALRYPLVYHNGTAVPADYGTGEIGPGELGFHPGPNGEFAVVRYTAPSSGEFLIDATFRRDDTGAAGIYVLVDGETLYGSLLDSQTEVSRYLSLMDLAAGSTVDFVVGVGPDGIYNGDTVELEASVPEPATGTSLIGGLALLARLARRARPAARPPAPSTPGPALR